MCHAFEAVKYNVFVMVLLRITLCVCVMVLVKHNAECVMPLKQ